MHPLTFLVFVCMTGLPFHSVYATYSYTCYPNNTITVSGLPTTYSTMNYFAIEEGGKNCTVTGDKAAGTAEITECDKDVPIAFTFSSFSGMVSYQIQGGQSVEIVNITCFEITDSGVVDSIADTLAASIDFDEETAMNVTYDITSALNPTSADVGDSVTWTIYYPMSYSLQITSCTAYPGTDSSSSNNILLITNWCTDESELISNFTANGADTEATATIAAFKFYNNANVYLECDLLVCPPSSSSCTASCGGSRRKRSPRENTGEYSKRVGKVLHIIDTNSSSASKLGSGFLLSFLLMYLVSLL